MFGRNSDLLAISAAMAGNIDPALRLLSDTQAALTRLSSVNEGICEAIGGLSLEAEIPASLSNHFDGDVFARIDAYERDLTHSKAAAFAAGAGIQELLDLPQPLRDLALESAGKSGWTFAGAGVRSMAIEAGGKLKTKLLRIEPGHGAPNHDHTGTEHTLVITGAFHDETGRYGRGDLAIKRSGQIHHPIAAKEGICIALTVEEGDVAFTGALGMLQRMFTKH